MFGPLTLKLVGRKGAWLGTVVIFGVLFFTLGFPHGASAQFGGFDPAGQIANMYSSNNWLGQAQQWALRIYLFLLVFEFVALAITTLLFRENAGEFISGIGLKILLGGVFFYFVVNGGVNGVPGKVIATFTQFGQQLGGSGDPTQLAAEGLIAAGAYFESGQIAKTADAKTAALAETLAPPGNCVFNIYVPTPCYRIPSTTAQHTHEFFILIVNALAVMIAMAVAAIYLQFALITIETYLVMGAGTLFIGFVGSRFTMPFSQGYFSYMINVGVKLMVLYIILGMEGPLLNNILISSAATLALTAATDLTGLAYPVALATALYGALSVVIGAALVSLIPGFASSFLTGQSTVSGSAALQQTMSSVAGSAQMMAQFANASQSRNSAESDRSTESKFTGLAGAAGGAGMNASQGATSMSPTSDERMAPPSSARDSFAPAEALGLTGNSSNGAMNDLMQMSAARSAPQNGSSSTGGGNLSAPPPQEILMQEASTEQYAPLPSVSSESDSYSSPADLWSSPSPTSAGILGPQGQNMDTSGSGSGRGGSDKPGLQDYEPADIRDMTLSEFREALPNSDLAHLALEPDYLEVINANPEKAKAVREVLSSRANSEDRTAALSEAYGLSGLAQAVPRDVGQPTAVQVRISNPDKL